RRSRRARLGADRPAARRPVALLLDLERRRSAGSRDAPAAVAARGHRRGALRYAVPARGARGRGARFAGGARLRPLPRRVHPLPRRQPRGRPPRPRPERAAEHRRVPPRAADQGVHPQPARVPLRRDARAPAARRRRSGRARCILRAHEVPQARSGQGTVSAAETLSLLESRCAAIPAALREVLAAKIAAPRVRRFAVTGGGLSEGPARFLVALLHGALGLDAAYWPL